MTAAKEDHEALAKLLLEHDANVDARDDDGPWARGGALDPPLASCLRLGAFLAIMRVLLCHSFSCVLRVGKSRRLGHLTPP